MIINFIGRKDFWLVLVLIIFLIFLFFRPQTKADLVYFYPQTCLGSFVNPEKAQGEREVDSPDLINELNSAVYYGGFKEIYCGNFQGPLKDGEIKKVSLYFNWVLTKELKEKPAIDITSQENFIEKIIPSKKIEINIGTSDTPILEGTSTNIGTSSQIFKFINFAFAQQNLEDINQTSLESTPSITETKPEISSSNLESSNKELNLTNTTTEGSYQNSMATSTQEATNRQNLQTSTDSGEIESTSKSVAVTSLKSLFDVHYTLDGQNWNYLGSINENNWQNISFDIPVNNWLDISKIQIKINSLPDTDYYLYLESMWLEVEYVTFMYEEKRELSLEEISILNKKLTLDPNFEYQKLIKIKGISNNKILAVLDKGEIWFFDLIKEKQIKISEDINPDFDIGIKNNYAFWISKNKSKLYYLNLNDLTIKEKLLGTSDFSQRIYLDLPDIDFTVILEGNNFYFNLPQIGEVFSDENSIVKDNFIKVFGLNKLLDEEELNNLGYYEENTQ